MPSSGHASLIGHTCLVKQRMALGASVAGTQYVAAFLWLLAALVPPSLLRFPDSVFEVLAPLLFAGLFGVGVGVLLAARALPRRAILFGGTALCGFLVAATVAIGVLVPTSLLGF